MIEFHDPVDTFAGVLTGTLSTAGPAGSVTAGFDGILTGQPHGIPDSTVTFSVYDGLASAP